MQTENGRKCIIEEYFQEQQKSPPETCDFTTLWANLTPQYEGRIEGLSENSISGRSRFWEKHKAFKPENWQIIPLRDSTTGGFRTYSFMEFAFKKELHWEDRILDPFFKPLEQKKDCDKQSCDKTTEKINAPVVCLLAATACGKTSTIIRALSEQYGFYFCCDANTSIFDVNRSTRDYLMDRFYKTLKDFSEEEIIAFGGNLSHLVYISRLLSLYFYCTNYYKYKISPSQFLKLQTNTETFLSRLIFEWLVEEREYYQVKSSELVLLLKELLQKFRIHFGLPDDYKFPIVIDEVHSFCPNDHDLLRGKYTCTANSPPRKNDLFALILATFSEINENRLYVTGTAFSAEVIEQIKSNVANQDEGIQLLVGQSLIETKADLLLKLKSFMNVTKELAKFINTSIKKYLPMRRRVFARACSDILENDQNTTESFKKAFDDTFLTTRNSLSNRFTKQLEKNGLQHDAVKTLLKFFSLFDCFVFEQTFFRALPQHLENFKKILIATGIAPYYTDPPVNLIGKTNPYDNLEVHFLFREPLCMQIVKDFCKDMEISKFWQNIFELLVPKEDQKNTQFDAAFIVILTYLSWKKIKICDLPFCKMIRNDKFVDYGIGQTNFQKQRHKFLESQCIFTVKAVISSKTIKTFLARTSKKLNAKSKKDLTEILSLEGKNDDSIYWNVFDNENLFHLLVGVCYLPVTFTHPDCWILTKLADDKSITQENCGFISFAHKIHRDIKDREFYKQENSKNTFQSSMEYIYSQVNHKFTEDDLKSASFMDLKSNETGKNILSFTDAAQDIRDKAFRLPNMPITLSLCKNVEYKIHDDARKHALQITSSSIDHIFPDAYKIIFPKYEDDVQNLKQ